MKKIAVLFLVFMGLMAADRVMASPNVTFKNLVIPSDGVGSKFNSLLAYDEVSRKWHFVKTKQLASGEYTLDLGTVTIEGAKIDEVLKVLTIENTVWEATPPTKAYEFTINLTALGSSTTLFTIGTPVAGYRAFIEYVTMVRDEAKPLGYMSLQLIDAIKDTLLIGGEVAPAHTVSMFTPPTPLIVTDCKLTLQEKGGAEQKIKISCIVSVRKVSDTVFEQPY